MKKAYIYLSNSEKNFCEKNFIIDRSVISYVEENLHSLGFENKKINDESINLKNEFENILNEDVIIVKGNVSLLSINLIEKLIKFHKENKNDISAYNLYEKYLIILKSEILKEMLIKFDFNLEYLVKFLEDSNYNISRLDYYNEEEFFEVNNAKNLLEATNIIKNKINKRHISNGVILESLDNIVIGKDVVIGKNTIIESNTRIIGKTQIDEDSYIGMNSKITDMIIGKNVKIDSSFIEKSVVEDGCDIGPFARIRPNSHLHKNVHLGNYVEVKNSTLGEGTKAGHLAYIGDADLGKNVNVSCGVIFCNYDGIKKSRSIVGDNVFLGSNCNIVSPVNISDNSFIAAGSTITKDVKEGQLAIERFEQKNIDGYYFRKFGK